jgi:hypothetical protein
MNKELPAGSTLLHYRIVSKKADSARRYIPGYFLAPAYLALGDNDAAIATLEKDINERCIYMQWIAVDPELDGFRSDPRFAALVKKVETSKLD